jgi:hypothetical protein
MFILTVPVHKRTTVWHFGFGWLLAIGNYGEKYVAQGFLDERHPRVAGSPLKLTQA